MEPYPDWEETLTKIAETGGTTMVLGGMDVGKTTFVRLLVNRVAESGKRVALIDADLGQSEVGPPACVGLAFTDVPVDALSDLTPHTLAFIGSTSPPSYLLEHAVAVRRLADLAVPHFLIVDTSGYLHGSGARRPNQTEFDLLSPKHVVALQRNGECEPILLPMRLREGCQVHTPPVPAVIQRKPPNFRTQRRAMRFAAYFHNSTLHTYSFDDVVLLGTWMGTGTPVAAHLHKFINQTLGPQTRVFYAEQSGKHLGLMVNQPLPNDHPGISTVLEEMRANEISATVAPRLKHLLLGLEGTNGKLLGLGLMVALDFRRRTMGVLTPVRTPAAARIIRLGSLRVTPEGHELGSLRPGEL